MIALCFTMDKIMSTHLPDDWSSAVVDIAVQAGNKILAVYNQAFDVEHKEDGSPLTQADQDSHHHIVNSLSALTPDIPVVSEESHRESEGRCEHTLYWLVDPLDGTKEFIKRNGEFTVNIALMRDNRPVWGVVQAPVMELIYYGGPDMGAFKRTSSEETPLKVRTQSQSACTLVVSRSHLSDKTRALFGVLENAGLDIDTAPSGSSLKFCMIADAQADCYPRLGLTSEWDTAAAEAVLLGAGGEVVRMEDGKALDYNKTNILNPEFMACGQLNEATRSVILDWYQQS